MPLKDSVHIARRFLRSIRIDADLGCAKALEGFICPQSSTLVLSAMARHFSETGHGAFTWTGPYGSGKSSLVLALSALLRGDAELRKQAARIMGRKLTTAIVSALPTKTKGWRVLPIVGRREHPVRVIGEGTQAAGLVARQPRGGWTESSLIRVLEETAASDPGNYGGLLIFIDEMGKFLEAAAHDGTDIYFFQQLAEAASRGDRRLLIVGILHQAFEDYAHRLSSEVRDEWAKIRGRFIDLPVNAASEEQIDLISRAIESNRRPKAPSILARTVAGLVHPDQSADAERLALTLENCWPLHPVVAFLLGSISRRRFGQNQRSIFGFLNSAEPHAFQEFLRHSENLAVYGPDRLWDYLRASFEPSILSSPDGHRWALATEAIERCESIGGDALHIRLLKTIAVVDLFKERSALAAGFVLLQACFPDIAESALREALNWLDRHALTLFRKFLDAYAVYAGSDFDVEAAIRIELAGIEAIDFTALKALAGLHPILAKRHYHETGALRWFEVSLVPLRNIVESATQFQPSNGAMGRLLLAIPTEGENDDEAACLCLKAAGLARRQDIIAGFSRYSWGIMTLARELAALENVGSNRPELAGDAVARREVAARLADLQGRLERELHKAFNTAQWFHGPHSTKIQKPADLNSLVSELADRRFHQGPKLRNELLNRQRPSGNAVAAQNALLRCMILNEGKPRLGISGCPAEGGLFASLLEATGLYAETGRGLKFRPPHGDDPGRLAPLWAATVEYLRNKHNRMVALPEIYDLWRAPPYGVKDGIMPILAAGFILSQRDNLATYREGIFRAHFDDVDVEYLAKDSAMIQLRWVDFSDISRRLLYGMAEIVLSLGRENAPVQLEPLDVARGLVAIFERLPPWTKRTARLSANAVRIREIFKRANDPNRFLFDDIPLLTDVDISRAANKDLRRMFIGVRQGLEELIGAYPSMLHSLCDLMLAELQSPSLASRSLAELRNRADNIRQLAGDFRLEAFIARLARFDGTDEMFEGIASLAVNKPPRDWVDLDLDRAMVNIAEMAQGFLRAETFARVKGRPEKRRAMAVVIGIEGRPVPLVEEFQVAEADQAAINNLIARVASVLETADISQRNVILAALAELSTRYMAAPLALNQAVERISAI